MKFFAISMIKRILAILALIALCICIDLGRVGLELLVLWSLCLVFAACPKKLQAKGKEKREFL